MNPCTTEQIAERLDRLERENRLLRWIGSALFVGLVVIVSAGTTLSGRSTLKAQGFELRDDSGRSRAKLALDRNKVPHLTFFDPQGREQIIVSAAPNAANIELLEQGQVRVSLNASSDGSAMLHFFDKERNVPTSLYMWPDSSTGLFLSSRTNPIHLSAKPDGDARLSVLDADMKERSALALTQDGAIRWLPAGGPGPFWRGVAAPASSSSDTIDGRAFSTLLGGEAGSGL